jgi:hypothetical protein
MILRLQPYLIWEMPVSFRMGAGYSFAPAALRASRLHRHDLLAATSEVISNLHEF